MVFTKQVNETTEDEKKQRNQGSVGSSTSPYRKVGEGD